MEQLIGMFVKGAGAGAWIIGLAIVLTLAMPVVGLLLSLIGRMFSIGRKEDEL